MIKNKHIYIIGLVVVLCLVIVGLILFGIKKPKTIRPPGGVSETLNQVKDIALPVTIFDTTTSVDGTSLSFAYPSKGFYNLGVVLTKETPENIKDLIAGYHIETTEPYDSKKGSEFVVVNVSVLKNDKSITFDGVNDYLLKRAGDIEREGIKEGSVFAVGSDKYFIYKVSEDVRVWSAYTVAKDGIVMVTMAYTGSEGAESEKAYANNDSLFKEVLSHIILN